MHATVTLALRLARADVLSEVFDGKFMCLTGYVEVWAQALEEKSLFSLILVGSREWEGGCDLHAVARDLS